MTGFAQGRFVGRLVLGLAGLLVAGCSSGPLADWRAPWSTPPDTVPGLTPPHQRMADLRALAANGPSADAARRQEVAGRLAKEFAEEPDPLIRAEIVRALAAYSGPGTAETLRRALEDPSAEVRIAACASWGERGRAGDRDAVSQLSRVIASDTETDVRLAAARALGRTGNAAAVAGLGVALDDQDPALQRRAVLALREVSGRRDLEYNVQKWRDYVRSQTPATGEPSALAQRPGEAY